MLLKLLPDQITANWEWIKYTGLASLPDYVTYTQEMLDNALENLLCDNMQCWWLVTQEDGEEEDWKVHLIVITSPVYDNVIRKSMLRICAAFGVLDMSRDLWKETLDTLVKYATAKGYVGVDAFTDNPAILRAGKMYDVKTTNYIYYEIK